jgi:hypothetical protein
MGHVDVVGSMLSGGGWERLSGRMNWKWEVLVA